MRKLVILAGCAALLASFALPSMAEEGLVKVGGHMKGPILTDNVWGKYMKAGVKGKGSYSAGTYFTSHAFIMYVSKDINENLSVEAAPDFGNGGAGATPSLGKKLGESLKDTGAAPTLKFNTLTVNLNVPKYGVQLRAGYLNVPFIQDYGKEIYWHEEFNAGKFTLGNAWHDTGLEIYKPFEIKGFSLPTSLYILNGNGSSNRDNNNSRAVMLHVEPQFGPVKTFASAGYGKWGDTGVVVSSGTTIPRDNGMYFNSEKVFTRYSTGAEYAWKAFKVRAEAACSTYEKNLVYSTTGSGNKDSMGYYARFYYTVKPEKLTALLHYNYYLVDAVNSNRNGIIQEKYDTTYAGIQYELAPAATFIAGYMIGNWRNNDILSKRNYVRFQRIETGLRVTF